MQGKPVIRHRRKPVTAGGVLRALAILGYLIFALFPVFIMISISFTDNNSDYLEKACKYGQITG